MPWELQPAARRQSVMKMIKEVSIYFMEISSKLDGNQYVKKAEKTCNTKFFFSLKEVGTLVELIQ